MAANHTTNESLTEFEEMLSKLRMFEEFVKSTELQNNFAEMDTFAGGDWPGELDAAFSTADPVSGFSACDELIDSYHWSQDLTPMHFPATMDSQPFIFNAVGSPASANIIEGSHDQAKAASSGFFCEQSDADDKAAKLNRRRISNKESARKTRTRKRAEVQGLEWQNVKLTTENATLCKHLNDSWLQFYDAITNNRILRSKVEALRAKVKLAEGMISRRSNQFVGNQSQMNTVTQFNHMNRMAHVSPANTGHEINDASYALDQFGSQDVVTDFNML